MQNSGNFNKPEGRNKMKVKKVEPALSRLQDFPRNPYVFIWYITKGFRRWYIVEVLLSFLLSYSKIIVQVIFAAMVAWFGSINPESFSWTTAGWYLGGILLTFMTTHITRYYREITVKNKIRARMTRRMKESALSYLSGHSAAYLAEQKAGQLAAKVASGASQLNNFSHYISRMTSNTWILLISFYYIGRANLWFLPLVVLTGCLSAYLSFRAGKAVLDAEKAVIDAKTGVEGELADGLSNVLLVKMFGQSGAEKQKIRHGLNKLYDANVNSAYVRMNRLSWQRVIMLAFRIGGAFLALWLWQAGRIDMEAFVLTMMLLESTLACFQRFLDDLIGLQRVTGGLSSSLEPLAIPHGIVDAKAAQTLKVKQGAIEFRNIEFGYSERKKLFADFSLRIKAGEKVGLVGKTGSGKTSLINLLLRSYEVSGGEILIDGQNIKNVTQSSLHQNIGIIPQENTLFHRTIRQNIAYGNPKAANKAIYAAAKDACADGFIEDLPCGYDSMVGEKGIKLSGGERQRVAIARAILKDAPILILDEATSALDNEVEAEVSQGINNLIQGKTVIAVAHRLSTLKAMDRILVLDRGKIIEEGTPDSLIKKGGKYAKLWKLQTS